MWLYFADAVPPPVGGTHTDAGMAQPRCVGSVAVVVVFFYSFHCTPICPLMAGGMYVHSAGHFQATRPSDALVGVFRAMQQKGFGTHQVIAAHDDKAPSGNEATSGSQ